MLGHKKDGKQMKPYLLLPVIGQVLEAMLPPNAAGGGAALAGD